MRTSRIVHFRSGCARARESAPTSLAMHRHAIIAPAPLNELPSRFRPSSNAARSIPSHCSSNGKKSSRFGKDRGVKKSYQHHGAFSSSSVILPHPADGRQRRAESVDSPAVFRHPRLGRVPQPGHGAIETGTVLALASDKQLVLQMNRAGDIEDDRRTAETVRESERQWQEVFEHNPLMYFMVDGTGTVRSVSTFGALAVGLRGRRIDRALLAGCGPRGRFGSWCRQT